MAPLHLHFTIPPGHLSDAMAFGRFLKQAAKKHGVLLKVRSSGQSTVSISAPSKASANLDMFLQELLLTGGLYYHLCGVSNRRAVAGMVVKPIVEELLLFCFSVVYPVLINKHLLGGQVEWGAGEFVDHYAQRYEILLFRYRSKMISGYEFMRDLDDLLNEFMLVELEYKVGEKTPKFEQLVNECGRKLILRDKRVRKLFLKVHSFRTQGHHRLKKAIPPSELSEVGQSMYYVFSWIDDFWKAQEEKTVSMVDGKRYRRVRYGNELSAMKKSAYWQKTMTRDLQRLMIERFSEPCGDCSVILGELHLDGCDLEICPRCGGQYWGCPCIQVDEGGEEASGLPY